MSSPAAVRKAGTFQLRFQSLLTLFDPRTVYSFPCDPNGQVDMDALDEFERTNYLYARAVVGREFAAPRVQPSDAP